MEVAKLGFRVTAQPVVCVYVCVCVCVMLTFPCTYTTISSMRAFVCVRACMGERK